MVSSEDTKDRRALPLLCRGAGKNLRAPTSVWAALRGRLGSRTALLLPVALGCLLGATLMPSVHATGVALSWSAPQMVDPSPAGGGNEILYGVFCTSSSWCVAVDQSGNVLTSTNPTASASAWNKADVDGATTIYAVTCQSTTLCVATDYAGNALVSTDPLGGSGAWTKMNVDGTQWIQGISCPSATLCVGADYGGNVVTSTNPTGGASTWTVTNVDGTDNFDAMSCPSTGLCVGVDGQGNVVTSTNPTGGASAWHAAKVDGTNEIHGISCPSATLCVAVDISGNVVTSTNPTGGSAAWTVTDVDSTNYLNSISCPTATSTCIAVDSNDDVVSSTNPTGGAGAWSSTRPSYLNLKSISCPTTVFCFAVSYNGTATSSTTPTGTTWSGPTTIDTQGTIDAVACPTTRLCIAVDSAGDAVSSTDPVGGVAAWTVADVDGSTSIAAVTCPSATLCVAVDGSGNALTATNPTGGAAAWTKTAIDGTTPLTAVSCATTALCVALDNAGNAVTATNPTGGAAAWTKTAIDGTTPLTAVSCATTALCVALDNAGNAVTSTNPTGGAAAWTKTAIDGTTPLTAVSCATTALCVAVDNAGNTVTSTNPTGGAAAWTKTTVDGTTPLTAAACPTATACVVADGTGTIVSSTNPTGGAVAWATTSVDASPIATTSCAGPQFCVAGDTDGQVVVTDALFNDGPAGGPEAVNSGMLNAAPTLSAPTTGTSCSGGTNVSLSWSDSQSATAGAAANSYLVSGYNVLRATSSSGPYSTVGSVTGAPPATSATDCAPSGGSSTTEALVMDTGTTNEDVYPITESASPSAGAGVALSNQGGSDPSSVQVTPDGSAAIATATTQLDVLSYSGSAWSQVKSFTTLSVPNLLLAMDPTKVSGNYWGYATAVVQTSSHGLTVDHLDVYPVTINGASSTLGTAIQLTQSGVSGCCGTFGAVAIGVTPDGSKVYVVAGVSTGGNVYNVYEFAAGQTAPTVTTIALTSGDSAFGLAITSDSSHVYTIDQSATKVEDITTSSESITSTVALAASAFSFSDNPMLGISADGKTLYVAEPGTDEIQVVNSALASSNPDTVAASVSCPAGDTPNAVAVEPGGTHVWVTDSTNKKLLELVTSNNTVSTAATLTAVSQNESFAVTPDNAYLYVPEPAATPVVAVVNTSTDAVTNVGSVGAAPQVVAMATQSGGGPTTYWYEVQAAHANFTSTASSSQSISVG